MKHHKSTTPKDHANSKRKLQHFSIDDTIEDFKRTAWRCERISNSFLAIAAIIILVGAFFYGYPDTAEKWLRLHEHKPALDDFNPSWNPEAIKGYVELREIAAAEAVARKVGILVLMLFLVQVLVRTYRYNKRIANFYNSRAQSLEYIETLCRQGGVMKGKELTQLLRALKFLNTDSIDLGVSRTPADSIANVFKSR